MRVWADNSSVIFSGGGFELSVRHGAGSEYAMSVTSTSSSAPISDRERASLAAGR